MATSTDVDGVAALQGESEAEYVARQARIRQEAAERMRQKFGSSGGLGGGSLGGIGSNGCGSHGSPPSRSAASAAAVVAQTAASGLGTAASVGLSYASWGLQKAVGTASAAVEAARQRTSSDRVGEDATVGEDSRDLSDLLGRADAAGDYTGFGAGAKSASPSFASLNRCAAGGSSALPAPAKSASPSFAGRKKEVDYFADWGDTKDALDTALDSAAAGDAALRPPPAKTSPVVPAARSPVPVAEPPAQSAAAAADVWDGVQRAAAPPTGNGVHVSAGGGALSRPKKVAAKKASADSWGDFDDNW